MTSVQKHFKVTDRSKKRAESHVLRKSDSYFVLLFSIVGVVRIKTVKITSDAKETTLTNEWQPVAAIQPGDFHLSTITQFVCGKSEEIKADGRATPRDAACMNEYMTTTIIRSVRRDKCVASSAMASSQTESAPTRESNESDKWNFSLHQ